MPKVRVVKTASNAKAVQAVQYQNNKRIIVRHFGSAHTDEQLVELLETYFGIKHRRQNFYKIAPSWLTLKETVETKVVMIYCFMM